MRYVEWIVMFIVAGFGIALANFVGFHVNFLDSLPGVAILLLISLASVALSKIIPLKLPGHRLLLPPWTFLILPLKSYQRVCHRFRRKDQFHCSSYHGRRLCGNLHQRPAEGLCKAGL